MERVPVPIALKRKIKYEEQPDIPENELYIDHRLPVSKGGGNERENLQALTVYQHLVKHYQAGEFNAVNLILSTMSRQEVNAWIVFSRTL